ncbi:hypothetical protein [Amycolatopsis sp. NPDC059657]|uniref:hypothetical protein n=1 Tax=Amycolatopsis sp. NPDC059657 TaxID=3346899 RepID=UPI00366EB7C4
MAEDTSRYDKAHSASGVAPVQFSASAETHDIAVKATNRDAVPRSPFATDGAAHARD